MSVNAKYRKPNTLQFIETANDLCLEVMEFASYLEPRMYEWWAPSLSKLAFKIHDCVLEANEVYKGDKMRLKLRKRYLLKARGALGAISSAMSDLFDVIIAAPNDVLMKKGGVFFSSSEVLEKVDATATTIGELISAERAMLKGLLKRTSEDLSELKKKKQNTK